MFYATSDRGYSQPLRSDGTRYRDQDHTQGSSADLPTHIPRDGSSLLLNSTSYISGYSQPQHYFAGARHDGGARSAIPRSRAYLDAGVTNIVHPGFSSIGHPTHHRYHDSIHQSPSVDGLSYSSQIAQSLMPTLPQMPRDDMTGSLDLTALLPNYSPEPASTTTTSPSTQSSPESADAWRTSTREVAPEPAPRPRKARREKPRIELAPDQPPTTQGKPRARVYVACIQCRTRKIRCDGAKPVCHNCGRRSSGSGECAYDAAPKRRGPDKTPGARQRMARDVRNEIEGAIGASRRPRRKREDDTVKQDAMSAVYAGGSLSDGLRYTGQQVPSSWPLCFSPISPVTPDNYRPVQQYVSAQVGSQSGTKLSHTADCGCSVTPTYDHDLSDRSDSVFVPRAMPQVQSFNGYSQGFDSTQSYVAGPPSGYINTNDDNYERQRDELLPLVSEPSMNFTRKVWWDSLLRLYTPLSLQHSGSLTQSQRDVASRLVTDDLRFLFKTSNHLFSFFHLPTFFANYSNPQKRALLQPSLILAALAVAIFWQSSELDSGAAGREKALRLRDEAQSALEASYNTRWVDETLVQAAWLLALFETCAHPLHSTERATSALVMLDSLIRNLSLTYLDVNHPSVSLFPPRSVPTVTSSVEAPPLATTWSGSGSAQSMLPTPRQSDANPNDPLSSSRASPLVASSSIASQPSTSTMTSTSADERPCACTGFALAEARPQTLLDHTPLWAATPAFDASLDAAEIRKESCRRLCWSAMMLAASHISNATTSKDVGLDLFISDPTNYALLLSGESVSHSKTTVWALYDRSALLWHSCNRMRHDRAATDAEKARFAVACWLEADSIEAALNEHSCGLERAFIFIGREYLSNTRMCISQDFQRFLPLVNVDVGSLSHRKKAEDWLSHQVNVAKHLTDGLHMVTGLATDDLARRPFYVFWFMDQVARALNFWDCDRSLTVALEVCRAFLAPIEYLTALWPCDDQRKRYEAVRERLDTACLIAGLAPLPPLNMGISAPSSATAST